MAFEPRKPDYILSVKRMASEPGETTTAIMGCAWAHENGSASIKLNPGTVLRWDDPLYIGLYPNTPKRAKRAAADVAKDLPSEDEPHAPF